MKIIKLTASNVKRLRAVEITPDGTIQVITGRNAQGKAQPVSEPVLTPSGFVPMGEISVGDQVIGSAGRAVAVLGVFPQKSREVWDVGFADGSSTRCSPEHLWTVGSWVGPAWTEKTLTTAEIKAAGLVHREHARKWAVPLMDAFDCPQAPLPIEPYTLGVILGDAHIADTGYVQISTDAEIIDSLGVQGYRRAGNGCEVLGSGEWSFRLEALGLAGRRSRGKFVPPDYLAASIEQRAALLAGLLDTDGSAIDSAGSCEFDSTSEALADAVVDLVRGLGGIATKGAPTFKHYTYKGESKQSKNASWHVLIRTSTNPFRLARKRDRWTPPNSRRPLRRFIDSIERVEDEATQCILVDSADHLYVTKDYIVTHNTSVLDAIWLALGGGKASRETVMPIRDGEDKARVVLDLGDLLVTRTWNSVGSTLTVTSADGAKYGSPQAKLDALVGRLSFDPLQFVRLSPKDQREALLGLVDIEEDLNELDRLRAESFAERTDIGRKIKDLGATAELYPDVPEEEVSVAKLAAEWEAGRELERRREQSVEAERIAAEDVLRAEDKIVDLKAALRAAEQGLAEAQAGAAAAAEATADLPAPIDLDAIRDGMNSADQVNRKVRENQRIIAANAHRDELKAESERLTTRIADFDHAKETLLSEAAFPVAGLGFDADGVTYHDVPFSQASSAEQIRVSLAMAMAMNPELRVIRILDGSLLDKESMQIVTDMATEHDFQVWIERVDDSSESAVVIEDGAVQ